MAIMESAAEAIEQAASFYCRDLEALSEEQILGSGGGPARKPVDFTYEVALINRRIAARICGVEPPAAPEGEGWWVAPEELRSKEAIIGYMRTGCDELLSAIKSVPESESSRLVGSPGNERPAYALAYFASMHTMYHDAQLNYIQSLSGDLEMHWD